MTQSDHGRFKIEKVTLHQESEGPDYHTTGEFQVIDRQNGEIVARFDWSLSEAYLTNASYSGPDAVIISADGCDAVASMPDGREDRMLLPVLWRSISYDGVALTPETDFAALVRRIAAEDGPAQANGFREPAGQWLSKLYRRLGQTSAAAAVEQTVAALLASTEPRERACALRFYYCRPNAPGAARLWELAETRRDLFPATVPGSWDESTLDADLIKTLAMHLRNGEPTGRLLALAHAEALAPHPREDLLVALAGLNERWIVDHAVELGRAAAGRWQELLYALYLNGSDDLGKAAAALVAAGVADRTAVKQYADKRFLGDYYKDLIKNAL